MSAQHPDKRGDGEYTSPVPHDQAPERFRNAAPAEKRAMFEWLRTAALSDLGPASFHAALAMHELCRLKQEAASPSAIQTPGEGIYVASRVKHAEMWKRHRADGRPIIATWIDEAGEGATNDFGELWQRIRKEIASCRALVFYGTAEDAPWKGALVEVGMALAMGKRVYLVYDGELDGRTMRPLGSWFMDRNVIRVQFVEQALWRVTADEHQPVVPPSAKPRRIVEEFDSMADRGVIKDARPGAVSTAKPLVDALRAVEDWMAGSDAPPNSVRLQVFAALENYRE